MKLDIRQIDDLPRLSWCVKLAMGSSTAQVRCGPWVEIGEDWFVEGAWNGEFEERDFERSCCLMGSGCKIRAGELVIASPCHMLESLFLVRRDQTVTVANSLAFLLVASGLKLDPRYPYYRVDLMSTQRGLDQCVKEIPTEDGPNIRLLYYTNIHVDPELRVTIASKPAPPDWADYHEFKDFLVETLGSLRDNANAPQRCVRYELTSTLSSGHDSTAAAALAAQAGGKHAVTVTHGINVFTKAPTDDCGTKIADKLGLQSTEVVPVDYLNVAVESRAELAACGDVVELGLLAMEPHFAAKLVTTGHTGNFWMNHTLPSPRFARAGPDGTAYQELRLRRGFVHVPVPMLIGVRRVRIHEITHSQEMRPWSESMKTYDRPIPRRILSEGGVPRDMYGRNFAGGPVLATTHLPDALLAYYGRHRGRCSTWSRIRLAIRSRITSLCVRANALARKLGLVRHMYLVHWDVPHLGPNSMVVQWGQSVVRKRYRF